MRVNLRLIKFSRQFGLKFRAQEVFDLLSSRVQMVVGKFKMPGHVRLPQAVRTNQVFCRQFSRLR